MTTTFMADGCPLRTSLNRRMASSSSPMTPKLLFWALGIQVVLGGLLIWQAANDFSWFRDEGGGGDSAKPAAVAHRAVPEPRVDRFDANRAMEWARRQVAARPAAGRVRTPSARPRELLRAALPGGRFVGNRTREPPAHLRNIEGSLPGRGRPILLVAHYDTTPVPGVRRREQQRGRGGRGHRAGVLAAALAAAVAQARRTSCSPTGRRRRTTRRRATSTSRGCGIEGRGADVARRPGDRARLHRPEGPAHRARAGLGSQLWERLRAAARRVGVARVFPDESRGEITDDHTPFARRGIPAIDLIDFDYPCWQKPCDTMDKLDVRSLDASGETVLELVRTLR